MKKFVLFIFFLLFAYIKINCQVINYVNNGSFEEALTNTSTPLFYSAKYWGGIDSTKYYGELLSRTTSPIKVPLCSYTYQWPKHGNNYLLTTIYSTFLYNNRGYPRNRLKEKLVAGKAYCFSLYVNLSNNSTRGIDAIGAYFSDNSIDTITQCNKPITYLTPQVENTLNNIISDTLNWVLIRGQFIANGTEKYVLLGNFRNNINTNTVIANPTHSPAIGSEYAFDYVSLVELNLPAFAGRDTSVAPGSNIFLGRQPDVGIDEACVWYKLPSTTPIDTIAGFWVNPTTTSTYVVVQTICGLVKSDTVVVHMNLTGLEGSSESRLLSGENSFKIKLLDSKLVVEKNNADNFSVHIYDTQGKQLFYERNINQNFEFSFSEKQSGVYIIQIENQQGVLRKKVVYFKEE